MSKEQIRVENLGYHISDIDLDLNTFAVFHVDHGFGTGVRPFSKVRPISGYYPHVFQTGNTTGTLVTMVSNDDEFVGLQGLKRRWDNVIPEPIDYRRDDSYYGLGILHILSISYMDALGQPQRRLFRIYQNGIGVEISPENALTYTVTQDEPSLILSLVELHSFEELLHGTSFQ